MPPRIEEMNSNLSNRVSKVAIVGAGGRSGRSIVSALLKTGKHYVTAITRPESTSILQEGIHNVVRADYSDFSALVKALTGQEALIITLAVTTPPESQIKLIDAAIEVGVKYIIPNEWGIDLANEELSRATMMEGRYIPIREYIEKHGAGQTLWIGICCGAWYEFSLAGTEARYGFDFDKKTLTLYDNGNVKINTSTWSQVGLAVAHLLSLKICPDNDADTSACLSRYENEAVYISSFSVSQRDMFGSVLRVTGDAESDWQVISENVVERYERGLKMLKEGQMIGFAMLLYARLFYDDGSGDYSAKLDNDVIGLPAEDLDAATKVAIAMALNGETNAVH